MGQVEDLGEDVAPYEVHHTDTGWVAVRWFCGEFRTPATIWRGKRIETLIRWLRRLADELEAIATKKAA
jgi:hypothetical protein